MAFLLRADCSKTTDKSLKHLSTPNRDIMNVEGPVPLLVFFHGGALSYGGRESWLPRWLFEFTDDALAAGFILVRLTSIGSSSVHSVQTSFSSANSSYLQISADYQLLVPSNCHDILEDTIDLFKWIETDLNSRLAALKSSLLADLNRIVVSGLSAGGYLASQACLHATPKPKALCSIYPLSGDLLLDFWCTAKSEPFYQNTPLIIDAGQYRPIYNEEIPLTIDTDDDSPRAYFGLWLMQNGTLLDTMTGISGLGERLKQRPYENRAGVIPDEAKILFPQLAIADKKDFPPTILVYATEDGLIPIEEASSFRAVLERNGVEVEVLEFEGRDHAFDLGEITKEERERLSKVVPFLLKHLQ